MIGVKVK